MSKFRFWIKINLCHAYYVTWPILYGPYRMANICLFYQANIIYELSLTVSSTIGGSGTASIRPGKVKIIWRHSGHFPLKAFFKIIFGTGSTGTSLIFFFLGLTGSSIWCSTTSFSTSSTPSDQNSSIAISSNISQVDVVF